MSGQSAPSAYQPTGQGQADQLFQTNNNALSAAGTSLYNTANQGYGAITSAVQNNPYYAQAQAGAGQVAALGQGVAGQQIGDAATLNAQGNMANSYAPSVLATGFDPQSALYNRNLTSTMDSQNVASAQAGLSGSPFAAGVAGQTAGNFNLDWANNEQARQASAIAQLGQLGTTTSGDFAGASALGTQGLDTIAQSSALPGQTYLSQQNSGLSALNAQVQGTSAALQPLNSSIQNAGTYLGIGQSATGLDQTAAKDNNAQSAATAASLGQITGSLTTLFGL